MALNRAATASAFLRGEGLGLLTVAFEGELGGVELFLQLQIGPQRFVGTGVGFVGIRRVGGAD